MSGGFLESLAQLPLMARFAVAMAVILVVPSLCLSLPQVAATPAAALVAFEARDAAGRRLIDEPVLDSVIVLMVVTSILGPVLTEQLGRRLQASPNVAPPPASGLIVATA